MRRTGLLVGGWITATVLALALGLLGVRAVSNSVTTSRPASLSPASVRAALARSSTESSSSDDVSDASSSSNDTELTESSSSSDDRTPSSTSSSDDTASTASSDDRGSDGGGDDAGTIVSPAQDETYQLVGGSVGVRFENGEAQLLWAQPNAGYSVDSSGGSSDVDVRFRQVNGDRESRLRAFWDNGPQHTVEEK